MPAIPSVDITVQDQGSSASLAVPLSTVQLKIGCAIGGTPNQPFATKSPSALRAQFIGGPLVEAGGLVCQAGNIVVAVSCPVATKGTCNAVSATVPGGSTSVVTTTVDSTYGCWDTYFVKVRCLTGGTVGTAGCVIQTSLDAGRTWSGNVALGTATSLDLGAALNTVAIGGTGIKLNFAAGTLVQGDSWAFGTVGPQWNAAGVVAALAAFQASQYGVAGVGSAHLVGDAMHGLNTTTDLVTIHAQAAAGTAVYEYERLIVDLRDAYAPVAYGGSGETEVAWMSALSTAAGGLVAQPRECAGAGCYNTPSPFATSAGGAPAYRRPGTWSQAVRRTQVTLADRAGAVAAGPYSTIAVNPSADPADGFIYHDERVTPGLNAARIASLMTWPKKGQGFFQCQEPLLSAPGSQFTELVLGNVIDAACDIGYAAGVEIVSARLKVQKNGTLDPIDLNILQKRILAALVEGLVAPGLVSAVSVSVDGTANILTNGGKIPIAIGVTPDGYANELVETISLSNGG